MKRQLLLLAITLAGVIPGSSAFADPSPEIRRLMGEPVSMLDWGIQSLRDWVEMDIRRNASGFGLDADDFVVSGFYNWKSNQIEISVAASTARIQSPKNLCRNIVIAVRNALTISSGDKKVYPWTSLFQHSGYESGKNPDAKIAATLPDLVNISVILFAAPAVNCSGSLVETAINFQD